MSDLYPPGAIAHDVDEKPRGFWYMATPYSNYQHGRTQAAALAILETGRLHQGGLLVYSPIAHSHAIAEGCQIVGEFQQWQAFDHALIWPAIGVLVLRMDGWRESTGVQAEIKYAALLDKPVIEFDIGEWPVGVEDFDMVLHPASRAL